MTHRLHGLLEWGFVGQSHWEESNPHLRRGGIVRFAPRFSYAEIQTSFNHVLDERLFRWKAYDGGFAMETGSADFDSKRFYSLKQLTDRFHAAGSQSERLQLLEWIRHALDGALAAQSECVRLKRPAGLIVPENVFVVLPESLDGDYTTPVSIHEMPVVLPDLGFTIDRHISSLPSWLKTPHPYQFLWNRSPLEEFSAIADHTSVIHSSARLVGWCISEGRTEQFPFWTSQLAKGSGLLWRTLALAETRHYRTVDEFREALRAISAADFVLGASPSHADREAALAAHQVQSKKTGRRRLMRSLLLGLLILAFIVAWFWPTAYWHVTAMRKRRADSGPEPVVITPAPPPPIAMEPKEEIASEDQGDAEVESRLKTAQAGSGKIQITLIWFNHNDLDLAVLTSDSDTIWYHHKKSKCQGELDIDMNVEPTTDKPIENIVWKDGNMPNGKFKVFVTHYKNHQLPDCIDPTSYIVRIKNGDKPTEFYTGEISFVSPTTRVEIAEVEPEISRDQ